VNIVFSLNDWPLLPEILYSTARGDTCFKPLPKHKTSGPSVRRQLSSANVNLIRVHVEYRRSDTGVAGTPFEAVLGSHHVVDALSFGFAGRAGVSQGMDALLNFVNHLNPIGTGSQSSSLSSVEWPTWDDSSRSALTFWDPTVLNMTSDTEREESIDGLSARPRDPYSTRHGVTLAPRNTFVEGSSLCGSLFDFPSCLSGSGLSRIYLCTLRTVQGCFRSAVVL